MRPAAAVLVGLGVLVPDLDAQEPFPVSRTIELKEEGKVWSVVGRQHVPRLAKITNLRASEIRGLGEEPAVLEIDGPFKMKAVTGGIIRFENVWLEIGPECKELVLSHVQFLGKGGIRPSEKGPGRARIFMEYVSFAGEASFSISQTEGKVDLQASHADTTVRVHGARKSERVPSKLVFQLQACRGSGKEVRGLLGGLACEGVKEVLVRNCDVAGEEARFVDCAEVDFDGNNARSKRTVFAQSSFGRFGKTKIHNCDVRTEIVFRAPLKGGKDGKTGKAERLTFGTCWFQSGQDEERILSEMIVDQRRDPEVGVLVRLGKTSPVPLGFGG